MHTSLTRRGLASLGLIGALAACGSDHGAVDDAGASSTDKDALASDDAATSGSTSGDGSSASGSDGATPDGGSSAQDAAVPYDPSVYQHHKNGTRDGLYIDPVFTTAAAATTHVLSGFMGTVSTDVYAQPLYVVNGPKGKEAFIVATGSNHVTAYDASTGATLWDKGPETYGVPAPGGCSANSATLGIRGTPFIDFSSGQGVIYFDVVTTGDSGGSKHLVYAVKVADGTVLPQWPVDVGARVPNFAPNHQNQRGALQLVKGVLYVPYGGYNGDCLPYFGWVVGFPVANPQSPTGWHTAAPKGGIWGPGALPTDGTSVFPITGNTTVPSGGAWGGGEAVIRLGPGPTFSAKTADYFAPMNWASLDGADLDLGGASEVLFDMPGAPKPHLIAAGGKDSFLYLLDRDNLGGIGKTAKTEILSQSIASSELKGAPAAYTTKKGTYVVFHIENGQGVGCPSGQTGNLVAVKISSTASAFKATVAWCASEFGLGSPMVTTTDGTSDALVWAASDHLYAFDGDTGAKVAGGAMTAMSSAVEGWNTPIAAKGRIAVGVNGQLFVFKP